MTGFEKIVDIVDIVDVVDLQLSELCYSRRVRKIECRRTKNAEAEMGSTDAPPVPSPDASGPDGMEAAFRSNESSPLAIHLPAVRVDMLPTGTGEPPTSLFSDVLLKPTSRHKPMNTMPRRKFEKRQRDKNSWGHVKLCKAM